jgi:Tol biopolymer transport system component
MAPGDGRVAFAVSRLERHLWTLRRNPDTGLVSGDKRQITRRGGRNYYPAVSSDGLMLVWTSHSYGNGMLYYKRLGEDLEIKLTQDWNKAAREIYGSFSPDGQQVAYATTTNGSYEIWRNPSLTSIGLQVTATEHPVRDSCAAWSPQGDRIAVYSTRSGNWDIWMVNLSEGGALTQLTTWESSENYPAWSPDGERIAFRSDRGGNADIWVVDLEGGEPVPLVSHPAEEGWGSWSPDGRWFYFTSNRSGAFNVWVMPGEGGEARQVTDGNGMNGGLPDTALYTKFAVSRNELFLPLDIRRGDIYILEFEQ